VIELSYDSFSQVYTRAREIGAEALADELLNIKDDDDLVTQSHRQGALMMHGRQFNPLRGFSFL